MIKEKSCGAVVYAVRGGRRLYLVEHMVKGHTSICKGHVEGGETEYETAEREIREETALEVSFVDGFRRTISYSPYEGCVKDVVFFLARAEDTQTRAQPEEVESTEWLPLDRALTALTHRSDRETVLLADGFLEGLPGPFRPMRRRDRELTEEEARQVLASGTYGVLSLAGDGGYPYGVPLSYALEDGKIYFHGAKSGHKLDAARAGDKASFCVVTESRPDPDRYTVRYRSAVAFGRVREITDGEELRRAVEKLAVRYNPGDTPEHRERYIRAELDGTAILELRIERLTGKSNIG